MTLDVTNDVPSTAFPQGADPQTYANEMTSKVNGATGAATEVQTDTTDASETAPVRPDHIPEKFWDAQAGTIRTDDLAKAYAELEKKLGQPKAEEAPAVEAGEIEAPAEINSLGDAITAFAARYATNGEVGEDDVAALEKLGLPRQTIDTYMAGLAALERIAEMEAYEVAGGKDQFDAARAWAATGLSDAEKAYYEKSVSEYGAHKPGVEWLMAKYHAANPSEGSLLVAESAGSGDVFLSKDEMVAAMNDARYATSESYRREVADKLARSQRAGTLQSVGRHYGARR